MLYATHAEINLHALTVNARALRERAGGRKVLAAVKANAYGHGAVNVAHVLERRRLVDWFGVATVPEGIELRDAGVSLPILKLSHSFPEELAEQLAAGITPTVVDGASAVLVARVAGDMGRVNVHLAVDTGMGRIGCTPEDAVPVARRIDELGLVLEGVFTHLPVSDTPEGHDFTVDQLRLFADTVAAIQADRAARGLPPVPLVHGGASAAVLGHDLAGLTMVRPGVSLYGMYPDPTTPRTVDLEPVMSVHSRVSMVKRVPAGATVGYGRTWRAPTDRHRPDRLRRRVQPPQLQRRAHARQRPQLSDRRTRLHGPDDARPGRRGRPRRAPGQQGHHPGRRRGPADHRRRARRTRPHDQLRGDDARHAPRDAHAVLRRAVPSALPCRGLVPTARGAGPTRRRSA